MNCKIEHPGGERLEAAVLAVELGRLRIFAGQNPAERSAALAALGSIERIYADTGEVLSRPGEPTAFYWLVFAGQIRLERPEPDGSLTHVTTAAAGDGFGETPLLLGKPQTLFLVTTEKPSTLIRIAKEQFWRLLAVSPTARAVVQAATSDRLQAYQVEALHRERLISLGTLAAGLMHELHNPGAAATRSAALLRSNLLRLEKFSLRFSDQPRTQQQLDCMHGLLEAAMQQRGRVALSSLEQADAEEALACWLVSRGVENAFSMAPALVDAGLSPARLSCTAENFSAGGFSDALNWLESLVSSVALVGSVESSIARVTELASSVKRFAGCDAQASSEVDVHESLQSTLTLLDHKLRIRQIAVDKRFAANPARIAARGAALGQVWTNLIDNAADAAPLGSRIELATFAKPGWLAVTITDHGAGIPAEVRPHIFEAFFTTKPQGVGTGLGLEIVHRIVTQTCGGMIELESEPGRTCFTVWLPCAC
jgi:signal transduction histidine kinase